ncbi:MAG TPA: C40 family peptidase [Burkholderiaceae bacterium]
MATTYLLRALPAAVVAATLITSVAPASSAETDVAQAKLSAITRLEQLSQRVQDNAAVAKVKEISGRAQDLALKAINMIGISYKRGGSNPENGLDCSGLVRHVFKESWGAVLPRTAVEISKVGTDVKRGELQPGDLVFYNTLKRGFSHVGIYLGDNRFIHSPSAGGQVRIESMDVGYWKQRFNGARRLNEPPAPAGEQGESEK